ncbi:SCO family protein [Paenibacillus marinisediminis]
MAQTMKRYSLQIFLFALVLIFAIAAAWLYWPKGEQLPIEGQAPDFTLENVDGKTVSMSGTNGKVRLVYFFFASCPDVCPPTTYMLNEVQDLLKDKGVFGTDANLMSITFDPERDSREVLMDWATNKNKADLSGWYFLRGDEAGTAELMKQFQSIVIKDKDGNFSHSNLVILVDQEGKIRKFYNANDLDITAEIIAKDVMSLVK